MKAKLLRKRVGIGLAASAVAFSALVGAAMVVRASAGDGPRAIAVAAGQPSSANSPRDTSEPGSGEWIAYSTAPAGDQKPRSNTGGDCGPLPPDTLCAPRTRYGSGSDVWLVREQGEPKLVASRGDGTTWNVCPAFSPDGTKLAFGSRSATRRAITVVEVTSTGAVAAGRIRLSIAGSGPAPCPRWSPDASRVAYVQAGRVVVRGLDGSSRRRAKGDPVIADFDVSRRGALPSPTGDLLARRSTNPYSCRVDVARPDGSDERALDLVGCPYAVAAWSPDGRKLLLMHDVSGFHFTMLAVSIDPPYAAVPIVERVRVNHPRSWPGQGDVSWQPSKS